MNFKTLYKILALLLFLFIAEIGATQIEIMPTLGYLTMINVTEPSGGSPLFIDEGILYDEFSPSLSLLVRTHGFSLGANIAYSHSSDLFGDFQMTDIESRSLGLVTIYNYEMSDSGKWLFPMKLSASYRWMTLEHNGLKITGTAYEVAFKMGLERALSKRASFAFLIGRGFVWDELSNDDFMVHPDLEFDCWRFEFYSRIFMFKF
ncbi:hypothetical protein KAH81_07740 [bacterium]|nr:hypothetical protein [bacterium]